ncbi:MAG: LamG domain-containing protein [Candidatus Cloacimonetes bacterium]|nr:LamG domain-containing protein [Candidatus Cloacimonadota bacterium]
MKKHFIIVSLILLCTILFAQNFMLDFDGIDDYVEIPNHPSYSFGTDNFTVSFWFFKRDAARGHALTFNGLTESNLSFDFDDLSYTGVPNVWVYWM